MQGTERGAIDQWLAGSLMGRQPAWPDGCDGDEMLRVAREQGVAALLQARLAGSDAEVPSDLRHALDALAQKKAAQSLYRQAQCRAVLARLDAAGIPALVLKGAALAYWAYPEPYLRESGDIDLLLPSAQDTERAVAAIAPLGYTLLEGLHPGDLSRFESTCAQVGGGMEIDMHWRLSNTALFAFRFGWDELWQQSVGLPALAPTARALAPAQALLHACMHRTKHLAVQQDRLSWLYDLVVMAERFGPADWQALCAQAARHGVAGVCLANLRDAEARFGSLLPSDVANALAEASSREPLRPARLRHGWYFQLMSWKALPTMRMRWRWLRQQMFPGFAFLRRRHGTDSTAVALWRRVLTGVRRLRG